MSDQLGLTEEDDIDWCDCEYCAPWSEESDDE